MRTSVHHVLLAAFLSWMFAFGGCAAEAGGGDDEPGQSEPCVPGDVMPAELQSTFDTSCVKAGCHLTTAPVLTVDCALQNLVGVPAMSCDDLLRVAPGEPDASCLIMRLEGAILPSMPSLAPPLDDAAIDLIREWIANL